MKKTERIARDLGDSVTTGVEGAREWATPRVEAAVDWAVPRLEKGIETASPRIQEGLHRAASELAGGVAKVTPRIQDGLDRVAPRISQVVDEASPRIQQTLDKATPAIHRARDLVVNQYIPAASAKLGEAADYTARRLDGATFPQPVHEAVASFSGDKKALKNAQKSAVVAVRQAGKQLRREQAHQGRKRGFLIFGIIAAVVTAGVAAWKASKPVEDPWKSPAPVEPTPVPVAVPATETEASTEEVREHLATAETPSVDSPEPLFAETAQGSAAGVDADLATEDATDGDSDASPKPGPRGAAHRAPATGTSTTEG